MAGTGDTNVFGVELPPSHSISQNIDAELSAQPGRYTFPMDRPKYYTTLDFEKYRFRTGTGGPQITNRVRTGQITLPLPVQLLDRHTIRYDEKPIVPDFIRSLASALTFGLSESTAAKAIGGLAPNWYQTLMFDRPEYKRFELQFKLSPRNYDEATDIQQIITAINNFMSPGVSGLGTGGAILFTFPDIVKIIFHPNSKFLWKFKPAVIEVMAVNYCGGNGQKAFYHDPQGGGDGSNPPESVEITLQITEVEYWLTGDFTNENDNG